ncbi:MAG: serine/threonine protein kinase [Deltaproteobacteria bacterium]|nr:serine/threonine protein kinase [Deltaproteobacteria bacterium]
MLGRFGKYELIQRIAIGGMAEVFLARTYGAEGFVKELVIKRILPQLNEDPDFVSMFINEARLAARLQHANIVQIYDFDHVEGNYYIAMELMDGADLRRIQSAASRRAMPLPRTLGIHVGIEVLKGLHYAHTREHHGEALQIVHRDISPHNLLLSFAGEVKVVDFGIAKVAALHAATRTGMVKGKLTYMAPEQVRGDPVDSRTDLYALGIILWELLTGRRLYENAGSEGELVAAARRGQVPPLAECLPDVEVELAGVVDRLLCPDPAQRYVSAADALADLSQFSGATDAFEVSEYLRRLLPAGAERERRGQTAMMGQGPPSVIAAPADAATATMGAEDAEDTGAERDELAPPSELADVAVEQETQAARGFPWVLLIVLLLSGTTTAAVTLLLRGGSPRSIANVAAMTLTNEGEVDGVPVSPGKVYGPHGQKIHVSSRGQSWDVVLGSTPALATSKPTVDAGAPRPSQTPDARPFVADVAAPVKPVSLRAELVKPTKRTKPRRTKLRRPQPTKRPGQGRVKPTPKVMATKRGFGYVAVQVTPWAWVQIDGGRRLQTPVTKFKLREGRHTLRLSNAELKKSETLRIAIKKGELKTIRRNW